MHNLGTRCQVYIMAVGIELVFNCLTEQKLKQFSLVLRICQELFPGVLGLRHLCITCIALTCPTASSIGYLVTCATFDTFGKVSVPYDMKAITGFEFTAEARTEDNSNIVVKC